MCPSRFGWSLIRTLSPTIFPVNELNPALDSTLGCSEDGARADKAEQAKGNKNKKGNKFRFILKNS